MLRTIKLLSLLLFIMHLNTASADADIRICCGGANGTSELLGDLDIKSGLWVLGFTGGENMGKISDDARNNGVLAVDANSNIVSTNFSDALSDMIATYCVNGIIVYSPSGELVAVPGEQIRRFGQLENKQFDTEILTDVKWQIG